MKLTVRQSIFTMKFLEYFCKIEKPVHYPALAKELGLSTSTTYDLLKLLEKRGLLTSVYDVPQGPGKHGRSKVLFLPSKKNIELFFKPLEGDNATGENMRNFLTRYLETITTSTDDGIFWDRWEEDGQALIKEASREDPTLIPIKKNGSEDWDDLRGTIFTAIKNRKNTSTDLVIYELYALMKTASSPVSFCVEIISVILLTISYVDYKSDHQSLLKILLDSPMIKENLVMLVGLALGLSVSNAKVRSLLGDMQRESKVFLESINMLSNDELFRLYEFSRELWEYIIENDKVGTGQKEVI
jgi:hypothetical protein